MTRTATRTPLAYDTAHWHGALEDRLFVRPTAKKAEARALAVADTWCGGGGGSVLTRAWRAVTIVTHEEQDLAIVTH